MSQHELDLRHGILLQHVRTPPLPHSVANSSPASSFFVLGWPVSSFFVFIFLLLSYLQLLIVFLDPYGRCFYLSYTAFNYIF